MKATLLENWKDEYFIQDETYRNHVSKFVDYISSIGKANQPISITKDDVVNCIGHYNELKKINTIKTMEIHIESVKAFYRYLVGKQYTDDIFNNIPSFYEFKDNIIQRYNLSDPKNKSYLEDDQIIEILELLDGYFDRINLTKVSKINERKKLYKFLVLRLFIKITLIAPAKKSVICSLKKKDFSDNYRFVRVNDVNVRIPNGLKRDIEFSINLAEDMCNVKIDENDNIFEFVYNDTFRIESLNEYFCSFLKNFKVIEIPDNLYSYPIEIIMDSALSEMVKNGANPALIAKINGTKISNLEKKFYSAGVPINDADNLINQEVSRNRYYNYI